MQRGDGGCWSSGKGAAVPGSTAVDGVWSEGLCLKNPPAAVTQSVGAGPGIL